MNWLRKTPRSAGHRPCVLYKAWLNMRKRCAGTNHSNGKRYWAGVPICEAWTDYAEFRKWALAAGFSSERRSIDRIRSDRGYEPGNCQWLTKAAHGSKSGSTRKAKGLREREAQIKPPQGTEGISASSEICA